MKVFIILTSLFFQSFILSACSCSSLIDVFCHAADSTDNIVLIEILDFPDPTWGRFKIIDNINKEITEDTIDVVGADGLNCGIGLQAFNVGDTLILNLLKVEYTNAYNGMKFDWLWSDCWRHYLNYSDGIVFGPITWDVNEMSYASFVDEIPSCFDFYSGSKEILEANIEIYPNPTRGGVTINRNDGVINSISVFNTNGQNLISIGAVQRPQYRINTAHLPDGIYLLLINTPEGIIRKKLMKIK